ncbi:Thyroid hormone receptor-associated protein 3 [Liparis tanakae]|uniref:Thyroid hormone receptor-associated protein 3 n=1 Tax=Liparis tanakae TaxID=230148 RepID=A0A4Z2JGL6_9TELE|nr:Thyroid hormone receptor-associated protein 3 [Liparis tanakae]
MLSSFDFFSNEEYLDGDQTAISVAFRQFLEEQKKKAKALGNGKYAEAHDVDTEQGKAKGKASANIPDPVQRKFREDIDGDVSLKSFLKASPFMSEDEAVIKPQTKSLHKDWYNGDESSKTKIKVTHSAREMFDECFGKWQNVAYSHMANSDLDDMEVDMRPARKQDVAAAVAAALAKREAAGRCEGLSPAVGGKARKMAKSPCVSSATPPPPPRRRSSDRELRGEDSPFTSSRKQETKLYIKMDSLGDSMMRSSDILAEERQLSQDLVQSSKKDQEFRSIFQHVQAAPSQRSPSELFAQHIVTIVHHTKAQHFPSSEMTLNERFTMYQRRAAEKEMMKPRKSPEIHRRIDVSPSAFKKHSQLFEAMKSSEDGTYKDGGEKTTGDPMDLRLDIERRKKYPILDRDYNKDRGEEWRNSPDSCPDRSEEKLSKSSERSKKSQKKRSRSSSSSSSSSSKSQKADLPHGKSDPADKDSDRAQLSQTDSSGAVTRGMPRGGFQVRIRGRSWNQGNGPQSNHDDREREAECKMMDSRGRRRGSFSRGRARFIVRKATGGPNANSPKWANDKFQINGERGDAREETEQDHTEREDGILEQ